jgi:hypothetical protein
MKSTVFALIVAGSLCVTLKAFAWTVTAGFEGGTAGQPSEDGPNGFDSTADDSRYVDSPVFTGSLASSVSIKKGQTGYGDWGGALTFPSKLKEGDELWMRLYVYFPGGWDFSCGCVQGMKFTRVHVASASGSNEGYLSSLIKGASTGGKLVMDSEVGGSTFSGNTDRDLRHEIGAEFPRDGWVAIEKYIKFSSVPGRAIFRFWQDGNLIFEDKLTPTLGSSGSYSDFFYLFTYWNNGAPRNQTAYVDDIVLTNETPSGVDAHGNHFLGGADIAPVSENAPASLAEKPNPPHSIGLSAN